MCRLADITELRIAEYEEWRPKQPNQPFTKNPKIGCAQATISRELASLRCAFKLAHKLKKVSVPTIELGEEHNRRTGFFEWHDFVRVREHLPDYLRPPMTAAY